MNDTHDTQDILQAAKSILMNADKPALNYAVNYTHHLIQMLIDNEPQRDVRVQCLYVLNNIQHWRGDEAKKARKAFKTYCGIK